ncbi:LIM domain containing protein [Asbolus verrucosus]|uniref:LIM domain containing protein n=1 Tax=Asbolus verrucosus TaxID=1661398 RepID=A0A482WAQ8_ASBVE|nr:LIM domain containing protein [Asbolus verrucosus]
MSSRRVANYLSCSGLFFPKQKHILKVILNVFFYLQTEYRLCSACGEPISDKFLLEVSGRSWHARCLRCCVCQLQLDRQPSCFIRDRAIYCKADYAK